MNVDKGDLIEISCGCRGNIDALPERLGVFTDSRRPIKSGLFIPIVGERFDGHDFLLETIKNGASAALWQADRPIPEAVPADFPLFLVDDTLKALQALATLRRRKINPVVVAVTGSNGKTTTKDIIARVVGTAYRTHRTRGNLNNHIGVPLTLLAMPDDCEVCVVEMGMNHFGEIAALSKIAEPDVAVITNIGESHIEFLGSRAGIARAKMEITEGMTKEGALIIDGDEPLLTPARGYSGTLVRCGFGPDNDYRIENLELSVSGAAFRVNGAAYEISLIGRHNVKNAVYAIAVAERLKINQKRITEALSDLRITGMRLERLPGPNGSLLINDAYNASPTSMKAALETLADLPGYPHKVAVLGDMYELGKDERELHAKVAEALTDDITTLVTIGPKAAWIAERAETLRPGLVVKRFATKEEALPHLVALATDRTAMLFKASRLAGLETLVQAMTEGGQTT